MRKTSLLLLVAAVHLGYEPLAHILYPDAHTQAAKAIFYILRGFEGAILWAIVGFVWRRHLAAVVAGCWGAVESAQTALCRLALPIGGVAPVAPTFGGMCSLATDLHLGTVVAICALIALAILQEVGCAKRGR